MYAPFQTKARPNDRRFVSVMPYKGENLLTYSALLRPENALKISNYMVIAEGVFQKRKGLTRYISWSGSAASHLDRYTPTVLIFSEGNKTSIYDETTGTVTDIKTDWSDNLGFDGKRYGDYYVLCNGVDKMQRVSQTFAYDAKTAAFTVGKILTGGTSGATATILENNDLGATGTLTLGQISGTFVDNETITDDNGTPGSATANGAVGYTVTAITDAPICSVLLVFGNRLVAGNLSTDATATQYSAVDDGTNPPFNSWTNATGATDGGKVFFRNAGPVRAMVSLGDAIVVLADYGKWAYRITQIDSAGTLKKLDETISDRLDLGGAAAVVCQKGVYVVNEGGIQLILSLGQSNVPFSQQEINTSTILGAKYFSEIDFNGSHLVYDLLTEFLFVFCKKNSNVNNHVIVVNTRTKAFSQFSNWSISTGFQDSDGTIYGASSVNPYIFKCLQGYQDDGLAIGTEISGEIPLDNTRNNDLEKVAVQASLSTSTALVVAFDGFRKNGQLEQTIGAYTMQAQYAQRLQAGYGEQEFASGYGDTVLQEETLPCYDSYKPGLNNYSRLRYKITSADSAPHTVNALWVDIRTKGEARQRTLTPVT